MRAESHCVPAAEELRHGVPIEAGQHLMTMFRTGGGWLIADSGRLWDIAVELGIVGQQPGKGRASWGLDTFGVEELAGALAGGGRFAHLLRFSHTAAEPVDAGGYSITIGG